MKQTSTYTEATALGLPSHKLGMWVFLASEVMFFTGLIGAYIVLRYGAPHWPSPGEYLVIPIGATNTFILLSSSVTMVLALAAAQQNNRSAVIKFLALTVLLGSVFLSIKAYEYSTKFAHHYYPSTDVFWSCYFTLTGFHGLHVLGGVVTNLWLLIKALRGRLTPANSYVLDVAGLYWHFVDIVWIFLFPILYLM